MTQHEHEHDPVHGTIIRAPDGGLYFVPDSQLGAFRIPAEGREQAEVYLAQEQQAHHDESGHVVAQRLIVHQPGEMMGVFPISQVE